MKFRNFLVANLYLIGTLIIIAGFAWMFVDEALVTSLNVTMIAFAFTLSGILFWGLGFHYQEKGVKQNVPRLHKKMHAS